MIGPMASADVLKSETVRPALSGAASLPGCPESRLAGAVAPRWVGARVAGRPERSPRRHQRGQSHRRGRAAGADPSLFVSSLPRLGRARGGREACVSDLGVGSTLGGRGVQGQEALGGGRLWEFLSRFRADPGPISSCFKLRTLIEQRCEDPPPRARAGGQGQSCTRWCRLRKAMPGVRHSRSRRLMAARRACPVPAVRGGSSAASPCRFRGLLQNSVRRGWPGQEAGVKSKMQAGLF